jgi:Sec-independent protein secretion pathway component TatC
MLAGPILILYELSIWIVRFTGAERTRTEELDEDEREIGREG